MDGLYSQNRKTNYYSKWDWRDPSHVHIDPDEAKAGIPDLYLIEDGLGQVNVKLEDSSKPIDTISYKILHNGKEWEVNTYLYYFKAYVTVEAKGDEDVLNALYDEVDWNVKADIWMKVGMNRWNIQNYDEEMWGGILKLEVREAMHDTDAQSRSEFSPNARAQLSLFTDIEGGHLGQLEFDDFSSGWQNPDRIPDRGYFKTSIDFTVGKAHLQSGVLKHPWCEWTVVCHVLVTHRFVSPQQQLGGYVPPVMNDEQTWYTDLLALIDKLTLGINVLESLLILVIIGFAVIIVALVILPNIFRRR